MNEPTARLHTTKISPEEIELEKKLVELASSEAETELWKSELSSLKNALAAFDLRWFIFYNERESRNNVLKDIQAQSLSLELEYLTAKKQHGINPELQRLFVNQSGSTSGKTVEHQKVHDSNEARQRASSEDHEEYVEQNYEEEQEIKIDGKEKSDGEVKSQYRAVAKTIHPDLATCEEDRVYRETLMKELNDAYANNDINQIFRVVTTWNESEWCIQIAGIAGQLIRVIRRISHTQEEMVRVKEDIISIRAGSDYTFWQNYEDLLERGIDLWQDELNQIDLEIVNAKLVLGKLTRKIEQLKYEASYKSMRCGTGEITKITRIAYEGLIYFKCTVIGGKLVDGAVIRVHRNDKIVLNANIEAIRFQDCVVTEIHEGMQCALYVPGYLPLVDDLIECFQFQKRQTVEKV